MGIKGKTIETVLEIIKNNPGVSTVDIAVQLGLSTRALKSTLEHLEKKNSLNE